ncbi:hypothetical protein DFQ28_001558 [Apophysomyces sp. BC1034]|nr:hypothetical protein DFQ30_001497 [Apophysomyces sp. BC1015]KAG0182530.1 hypothetical protein DFQ29_003756 [Apophysomyces sp. BC1021]KAG0194066.1 hypothetical protein DFQ28_001558 [Apophysomyces sp. BC1034]
MANLVAADNDTVTLPTEEYLSGSSVSSLYRLRDIDDTDGGFFVFGDMAVKKEGQYKLHFSLFEIVEGNIENRKTILSQPFTVYLPKRFPGPVEATFLSRNFSDQGVKMRIRKEHRLQSASGRKRKSDVTTTVERSPKRKETVVPPYAPTTQEVHFGRWQSTTKRNSTETVVSRSPLDDQPLTNRFRLFSKSESSPSPSLPQLVHPLNTPSPSPSICPRATVENQPPFHSHSDDDAPPFMLSPPWSMRHDEHKYATSPTHSTCLSLPSPDALLESYHVPGNQMSWIPPPPPPLSDVKYHHWNEKLPSLRTVVADALYDTHPLILPSPFNTRH